MIFVDTSAIVAIVAHEADRSDFIEALVSAQRKLASPVVRLEACIVLSRLLDLSPHSAEERYETFLSKAGVQEIPITSEIGALSVRCYERYGKGRHPARLNFADCLSYACARAHGATLLYKGDDFSQTDVNAPA